MFDLELTKSNDLVKHEALVGRLDKNHPKFPEVLGNLKKLSAGYRGEKTVDYFLKSLPPKRHHIFQGLRLPIGKNFFQIDSLMMSAKSGLLIESKNYAGTLLFEKNQLTRTLSGSTESDIFQNPLTQANNHKILLKYFFEKNKIPVIPIEHLVCVANTTSNIVISPGYIEADKRVTRAENVLQKIEENDKFYNKAVIDDKTIGKLCKLLKTQHTPLTNDILQKYGIHKSEITGVQCPRCFSIPMLYRGRYWDCLSCQMKARDPFIKAINEYFLLIKPTITNQELVEFLQLPSARAATYLLSLLNLPYTGTNKGRVYHQPPLFP
ncbi:nuclease-related domain-containing protein [Neobacillus niacini]|uniref:nuclease-related domain-containing protein n=1 Tax=Neobacillus niacini TaxID=86668 RepID=UPI002FFFECD5